MMTSSERDSCFLPSVGLKFGYRPEVNVSEILINIYDGRKPEPRDVIATIK